MHLLALGRSGRRLLRLFPLGAAVVFVISSDRPARAQDIGCPETLRECYHRAAVRDDLWDRFVAGVECELDFLACVRRSLMGR